MEEEMRRKSAGSKLNRSTTATIRLTPQLRYMADLAARKHRRTFSSFVEWAVMEALKLPEFKDLETQNAD
jgi:hypothetical protein